MATLADRVRESLGRWVLIRADAVIPGFVFCGRMAAIEDDHLVLEDVRGEQSLIGARPEEVSYLGTPLDCQALQDTWEKVQMERAEKEGRH